MFAEDFEMLVVAAQAGGGWAFAQLWLRLSPGVLGYLRGRGVPDAEDVTSETFLAAYQRITRFTGDGARFRSWLFTIAHHKGVDAVRRGPGCHELPAGELIDGGMAPSAEAAAMQGDLGEDIVRQLLATLTDDQREVVTLRVVRDLTLEETARVVGKPVGAVKQLQRRGLARLRRDIECPSVIFPARQAIA